jgi:hypothetical protein
MTFIRKDDSPKATPSALVGVPTHKIADGVGAVVGAGIGATAGAVAGPVGILVGGVVGAIAGGLGVEAVVDSAVEVREAAHWRENYRSRPYVKADASYDDFGPAYAFGVVSFGRHPDRSFDELQSDLSASWLAARGRSTLPWDEAQPAARDAWDRISSAA